ncbi:hypothetical protein PAXRUDRAFT_118015, partial [Paxillus rubicundulus Ve08.2h10]
GSKKLFGNWQVLAKILKAALFSPKSIQVTCKSGHILTQQKTYAQIWGVTPITPGAVTWAITVVMHLTQLLFFLSPNISFLRDGVGVTSKISYKECFGQYKRLLIQQWNTPWVQAIATSMNQYLFGTQFGLGEPSPSSASILPELDVALAQLNLEVD